MKVATLAIALVLLGAGAASTVEGGQRWPQAQVRPFQERPARAYAGGETSLGEAIQMVERRFGARVVRSTVVESNGRRVYVLRVVSDREVRVVRVDAATGAIL